MDNPIRLHWLDPRNPRQPFPDASQAMRDLSASAADLTIPPYAEVLYAAVPD